MKDMTDDVKHILCQNKIFRLSEVMEVLSCSIATAKRRLKAWHVYSSYNKNASYYVLPDIPEFNEYQLWFYQDVCFSKHGNLKKTVELLIENSRAGLNVIEISKIIVVSAHNILSQQTIRHGKFFREKHHGIYIYYSKDPVLYAKQKETREKHHCHFRKFDLPSDAEYVTILVALIKHPNDTETQLSRRLQYQGLTISITKMRNLMSYHGLLKKNRD